MKKEITKIVCIAFGVLLSGCVALRPDSTGLTEPDYNQRVKISGPHYDKVLTTAGAASIAASTIGGGIAGYQSELIKINDGADQTTSKIGNAFIGATVGFGTSYLVNRLLGWGQTKPMNNPNDWLKKANKNFVVIPNTDDFVVIPKLADANYQIRNLLDANQFAVVFKNSRYTDNTFKTGVQNLYRDDLPTLINLFSSTPSVSLAKDKYIRTSLSYNDIVSATLQYPDISQNYENDFLKLIKTSDNAIDFKTRYNNSEHLGRAYLNAYWEDNQTVSNFVHLNTIYKGYHPVPVESLKNEVNKIQRNYVRSQYMLDKSTSPYSLVDIFSNYKSLSFPQKEHDFLAALLDRLDQSMKDGNKIIWNLKLLANNEYYPDIDIKPTEIENVINEKLQSEIASKVKIVRKNYIGSKNPEWEKWKENGTYAAGLVGSEDAAYILYGVIQNNSKYDLPLEIAGTGHLISKADVQGTGAISNFIVNAFKFLTQGAMNNLVTIDHGTQTASFYMNPLPSKSQQEYAIRLDFHGAWVQKGVNLFDTFKGKVEPSLTDTDISVKLNSYPPSDFTLQQQEENLQFAHNGLPDIPLQDQLRGKEYNDDEWKEEWRRIQAERARYRQEAERRVQAAKSSGSCYELIGPEDVDLYDDLMITGYRIKCKTDDDEYVVFKLNDDILTGKIGFLEWYDSAGWYILEKGIVFSDDSKRIGDDDEQFSTVVNNLCGCY